MNFKDKKITVMGLGLLGRGIGDVAYLAEKGADLIVTDLKSEEELASSLKLLEQYDNISYTLGGHKLEDFKDRDFILKAASVPADSPYIEEARKNGIQVEMSSALLVRLLKDVDVVGVTGTRGKSTVTEIIYEILKADGRRKVYLGGNVKGVATLPLLDVIKSGDILVLELDSWQLQGFHENKISPDVAVFTNLYPDHQDYYNSMDEYFRDKSAIFAYQDESDFLISGSNIAERIPADYLGTLVVPDVSTIPDDWDIKIPGEHNRENISLAVAACYALDVSDGATRAGVEGFTGLSGRIEFLREVNGVKYYNDNSSTTPEATIVALKALGPSTSSGQVKKNIILILGGTDKGLDMSELLKMIPKYVKGVVLLTGETGSDRIAGDISVPVQNANNPEELVQKAVDLAESGDIVLFSPAFASFGKHYKNVYDRGEQFTTLVSKL